MNWKKNFVLCFSLVFCLQLLFCLPALGAPSPGEEPGLFTPADEGDELVQDLFGEPERQEAGMPPLGPGQKGPAGPFCGEGRRPGFRAILDRLRLSPEQEEAISRILLESGKELVRKKAEIAILRMELGDLLRADQPDMKQVEGRIRQIEKLSGDMKLRGIRTFLDVKSKLTPEQRDQLKSMKPGAFRQDRRRKG